MELKIGDPIMLIGEDSEGGYIERAFVSKLLRETEHCHCKLYVKS